LQQEQERLLDGQSLLNQREEYVASKSQELNQLERIPKLSIRSLNLRRALSLPLYAPESCPLHSRNEPRCKFHEQQKHNKHRKMMKRLVVLYQQHDHKRKDNIEVGMEEIIESNENLAGI